MKRTHVNFLVDALAFAALLVLISTGIVLEYQLPPGSGGREASGLGHGAAQRSVELLWGWSRHEWGDFHFWAAGTMLALMAVHLFLHAKWIVCVVRGKPSQASGARLALGAIGLASVVLLSALPLLTRTQSRTREDLNAGTPAPFEREGTPDVRGSATIFEAAKAYRTTPDTLIAKMGLPADTPSYARIGPLMRAHGRRMSDLRELQEPALSPD
jgi:hypothetical protein